MEQLVSQRSVLKRQVSLFGNHVEKISGMSRNNERIEPHEIIELKKRLEKIEPLLEKFNEIQCQIEFLTTEPDSQIQQTELFENAYYRHVALAKTIIVKHSKRELGAQSEHTGVSQVSANSQASATNPNFVKLPTISLPKFEGQPDTWLEFRDSFMSLIHQNESISDIQRFHYLRGCLQGKAAEVIKLLEFSSENYQIAWENLCDRYNNTRVLVHNHIKALFNMETITKESSDKIRSMIDSVNKHLRAITSLTPSETLWENLIIYLITTKLDPISSREWEQSRSDNEFSTVQDLKSFLKTKADLLETLESKRNSSDPKLIKKNLDHAKSSRSFVISTTGCVVCNKPHSIQQCEDFLKLPIPDRLLKIKELKLCINCFRKGHFIANCHSSFCRKCKGKHHTLLHDEKNGNSAPTTVPQPTVSSIEPQSTVAALSSDTDNVLLSTVLVEVRDGAGKAHTVRALLDAGSQSSFITKGLCDFLKLETHDVNITVVGISQSSSQTQSKVKLDIHSSYKPFKISASCLVLPHITGSIPNFVVDTTLIKIPTNIQLADPEFFRPKSVDILIGADWFWRVLTKGQISLGPNSPVLQNTHFGWVISGPIMSASSESVYCNFNQTAESQISEQLSKFWELEQGPNERPISMEERYCESHFIQNTKRNEDGRFIVTIPLKEDPHKLGETRTIAEKRFMSLERKLSSNHVLRELYTSFMSEYQELGHMSPVESQEGEISCYLPHHGVLRKESLTTKLRVVFNASSETSSGYSLNSLQMVGPTIQQDLFSILLRFRKHVYAFSADIEKMYRQVLIIPSQRSLQRIVWRSASSEVIKEFNLNTVTYGTASAPFLAIRCLVQLGNDCCDSYPEVSKIIKNDFYVDDLLSGADTKEQAKDICQILSKVLSQGKFTLRKWVSNEPDILGEVAESNIHPKVLEFGDNASTKTLGLIWSFHDDTFMYTIPNVSNHKPTKRSILSETSQVFDPLGFLSPCTIKAKILLQQLWKDKFSWDDALPDALCAEWRSYRDELVLLNDLKLSRRVICDNSQRLELHGFADASNQGYGGCLYLRSTGKENKNVVRLLCSRTRVAPLKPTTIPRLELCGALTLAKLASQASKALNITFHDIVFWSDATIVLGWLNTSPSLLKPFVANRVAEIQEYSVSATWRHVPSKSNPADLLSRGVSPSNLKDCELWWYGPSWLAEDPSSWPPNCAEVDLPELKREKSTFISQGRESFPFHKYSNFTRMQRVISYCLRFKQNTSTPEMKCSGPLSPVELQNSLDCLVKLVQQECFYRELQQLKQGKPLDSNSKIVCLNPFVDEKGLIRVGGRLHNSQLKYVTKHPILLPHKHVFSQLLFETEHIRLLHAGPQLLLSSIREKFWPLAGRSLAKQVVHKCLKCFRVSPKFHTPMMGNLPSTRVVASLPFHVVGVDYAGPVMIKDRKGRGAKYLKAYICLFVCFASKAIHLELVNDLTTQSFILCLRRFIARRGKPLHMYSDNGRNFVGANTELQELAKFLMANESKISETIANDGINWHFIPPHSPHFGGLWEAGIKSSKLLLKRTIGNTSLTFEEMYSLLVQIESILNSRPLTPLSSNPQDLLPLCPAHFLIGKPLVAAPDPSVIHIDEPRLSKFQKIQQLQQQFWRRWQKEYLFELQRRAKWHRPCKNLRPGTMVLIRDNNLPPLKWKLGRIEEAIPAGDGIIRVASIRTTDGVIRRVTANLCPLPVEDVPTASDEENSAVETCVNAKLAPSLC